MAGETIEYAAARRESARVLFAPCTTVKLNATRRTGRPEPAVGESGHSNDAGGAAVTRSFLLLPAAVAAVAWGTHAAGQNESEPPAPPAESVADELAREAAESGGQTVPGGETPAAPELTEEQKQVIETKLKLYQDHLADEGFRPKVVEGEVQFRKEGGLYILTADGDPQYFQLAYPAFWEIESPEERRLALEVAEETNRNTKVAKIFIMNDNVWATVESVVEKPESFRPILPRAISIADYAVERFSSRMAERLKEAGAPATK
jgi:hypothetical protein